jgi:hypothetical protein
MPPSLRALHCVISLAVTAAVYPTQAASTEANEPSPDAVLGVLPFQEGEPNRVLVDLAAEGSRPFVMMLDTGAAASVVTPLMARHLGVSVRPHKSSPYRRATRLGRDVQFWVDVSSSDTGAKTDWEYGLLGGDFLDDYIVEIDFPGRIVRFLDPKKYQVPSETRAPDERVLPFTVAGTRIIVPVEISGQEIAVGLDTGAPSTLLLSGQIARKLGITVEELPEFGRGGTVLGPMEQRLYEAAEFRFAGFPYAPLPVIIAPRGLYNMGLGNDSLLGYDVLRPFVMRIDYANSRIWLKRTGDPRVTFLGADYATSKKLGALLIRDGKRFQVYHVSPGGLAARYGLREGDAIVPAEGEKPPSVEDLTARVEARAELTVARREGDVWVDHSLPEGLAGETEPE